MQISVGKWNKKKKEEKERRKNRASAVTMGVSVYNAHTMETNNT